jgi:hypothetical protein
MSTALLISLSNDQLHLLLAGAARVPREWRTRFLDNVTDLLLNQMSTTGEMVDADVAFAVGSTLQRIGVPVPA